MPKHIIVYLIIAIILIVITVFIKYILKNPYKYPYYDIDLDITGHRNVEADDEIEQYLLRSGFYRIQDHYENVVKWKSKYYKKANKSIFKFIRIKQYNQIVDSQNTFNFKLYRSTTRYRQNNYVKTRYTEDTVESTFSCGYNYLLNKYKVLKHINFETTSKKYNTKDQRKLMTKKLRTRIKKFNNYTCQNCGKYMPDEVGLHIDHIIPVSKGGKSVASNLQVLCSKCNGRKSNN